MGFFPLAISVVRAERWSCAWASEAAATQYACFAVVCSKGKDSMRTCSSDRGLLCPIALIPAADLRTIVAAKSVYGVAGANRCEPPARPSAPRIAPPATLATPTRKAHRRKLARLLVSVAFLAILLVARKRFLQVLKSIHFRQTPALLVHRSR